MPINACSFVSAAKDIVGRKQTCYNKINKKRIISRSEGMKHDRRYGL